MNACLLIESERSDLPKDIEALGRALQILLNDSVISRRMTIKRLQSNQAVVVISQKRCVPKAVPWMVAGIPMTAVNFVIFEIERALYQAGLSLMCSAPSPVAGQSPKRTPIRCYKICYSADFVPY
jgi:hypothetical protein